MYILYVQYDHAEIIQEHIWWATHIVTFGNYLGGWVFIYSVMIFLTTMVHLLMFQTFAKLRSMGMTCQHTVSQCHTI